MCRLLTTEMQTMNVLGIQHRKQRPHTHIPCVRVLFPAPPSQANKTGYINSKTTTATTTTTTSQDTSSHTQHRPLQQCSPQPIADVHCVCHAQTKCSAPHFPASLTSRHPSLPGIGCYTPRFRSFTECCSPGYASQQCTPHTLTYNPSKIQLKPN